MSYQYIKGVPIYDSEEELYKVKIGLKNKTLPLHYIVCDAKKNVAEQRADALIAMLNDIDKNLDSDPSFYD